MKLSLDFAFEGFRIVRNKPSVLLFWGAISLIFGGVASYLSISAGSPDLTEVTKVAQAQDMPAMTAMLVKLVSVILLTWPFKIILQAFISNAVFRTVLYDGDQRFGGLALGRDEARQVLVVALFEAMTAAIFFVCFMIASIFGAVLAAVAGPLGLVLAAVLGGGVGFWLVARLSLAEVQSFAQKRINLFGSWSLTKGSAGKLVLGYIIAIALAALVSYLCVTVLSMSVVALNGGNSAILDNLKTMTSQGTRAFENPMIVIFVIIMNFLIAPMLMAITLGAPAAAYKALNGNTTVPDGVF